MSIGSPLRSANELGAARDKVRSNREEDQLDPDLQDHLPYADGELATIDWVLGIADGSPVTHRTGADATDPVELDSEFQAALDMLYGRREMHRRGQQYVSGVEATLMWILGESDSEPF